MRSDAKDLAGIEYTTRENLQRSGKRCESCSRFQNRRGKLSILLGEIAGMHQKSLYADINADEMPTVVETVISLVIPA